MSDDSPLLGEHEIAGARMGVWFGTRLPDGYGNFAAEYTRARDTAAVVDTNFRLVAEFTGTDRVRYLNAITSGNIRDLAAGQSALGLLLNPQGHILAELRTLDLGDRLLMLSHAMTGERTLATLDKFIIMDDVTLTDRTGEFASVSVVGAAAGEVISELAGVKFDSMKEGEHVEAIAGGIPCRVIRGSAVGLDGAEMLVERGRAAELWRAAVDAAERHGGGVVGYEAINSLRIEAGVAWFGADFDDRVIPHEAGIERSHISYVKGCYTGQEIVERVRSRGQVNRRLAGLAFDGDVAPPADAKLMGGDGNEIGRVTSAARSPRAGRVIGMGYLRREFREMGSRVRWEGGSAEVIALPVGVV
ncbi:MAG: aminomethyltransferase family protein [Acidobacteriota bacterium]|nr:aminomethyltransferase family protein [Acidobacteriota bacterium]